MQYKKVLQNFFILIFLTLSSKTTFAQSYKNIDIPCDVKECMPEWGPTNTRWYTGDGNKKRPAIIWYAGGAGTYVDANYQPISNLIGKFDIIMVKSPLPVKPGQDGIPSGAFDEKATYRMRQSTEYYKKILNKPIWLGGISYGGLRIISVLSGTERQSDNYAGLIFSSIAHSVHKRGSAQYWTGIEGIKYEMNLPILIFQHERDQHEYTNPKGQKWFRDDVKKKNLNKTDLIFLTEGNPEITAIDGGHHWFLSNKDEVARIVENFIMDNSK